MPLTFHGPCLQDDSEHGMRQDVHNMLVQVWTQIEYISHRYDTIDKLKSEGHQRQNCCRPIEHDNGKVLMCPAANHFINILCLIHC